MMIRKKINYFVNKITKKRQSTREKWPYQKILQVPATSPIVLNTHQLAKAQTKTCKQTNITFKNVQSFCRYNCE